MKIAVLCGGLSPERNVSISSGTKIAGALQESGHQVVLLDMFSVLRTIPATSPMCLTIRRRSAHAH